MPELAPAMSETSTGTTPAGSPAIPRAESTETGLPAVSVTRPAVAEARVYGAQQSGTQVAHQSRTVIHHRGNGVQPISVIGTIAPVIGCIAVLVGQDLLQTAHRVTTEILTWQRVGHRIRELVGRHVDQPVVIHGLLRTGHECLRRRGIGEQVQDELDQRLHDQFPSTSLKLEAGSTGVLIPTLWTSHPAEIGVGSPG
jgi:hypothetical protein